MLAIVHAQTNNFVGIRNRRPQFQRVERQEPTPGLELRLRPGKDLQERLLPLLEKRTHGEVCLPAGNLRTTQEICTRINRSLLMRDTCTPGSARTTSTVTHENHQAPPCRCSWPRIRAIARASSATQSSATTCRRLLPGLASNAGEEGEVSLACQVQRADSPSGVQQPAVGQACAWPGGGLVIEFRDTGMSRLRRPIGDHGCGAVVLIELDPVAVELVVLVLDGLAQFLSLLGATGRVLFTRLHACAHLPDVPGLAGPEEGIVDQAGLRDAFVRTLDDLLADGWPLIVVGLQQRWVRLFLQHQSELPGQVVGVLDGGVRAEPIVWRMPVDGITHTEHAPMRVARCIQMIDAPERCGADLNRDGIVSDQVLHDPS